jgi:transcriptional regulator with XRE-family HTH domain
MPASPLSSAQKAREPIAARLCELRLDAGLTGHELSRRCGSDAAKTSRIEQAKAAPSDAVIRAWCAACGRADHAPDLIAASRQAHEQYVEWRRRQTNGLGCAVEGGPRRASRSTAAP